MYLLIQNPGVAPIETFTTFGLSLSRASTEAGEGTVGRFGSGVKHSVLMMLRKGIDFSIYPGLSKLSFRTESNYVNDGISGKTCNLVVADLTGKVDGKPTRKTLQLNWEVSYGAFDWDDMWMGLREFICNAIDRTHREFKVYRHDDLRIELVEDNKVRAKDGTTRIFIELRDEVSAAYNLVHSRILHLTRPHAVDTIRMMKTTEPGGPTIYKNGIYVRKAESQKDALRNYNCDNELRIDESRNVNEGEIRDAVSKMWATANADTLAQLFREMRDNPDCWESTNLCPYDTSAQADQSVWKDAFNKAYGENAVVSTSSTHYRQILESKGFNVIPLNENMVNIFKRNGCTTTYDALNADERDGREILPPTQFAQQSVDKVWSWYEAASVIPPSLAKPTVKCFREIVKKEQKLLGFVGDDKVIYLNKDYADGQTTDLLVSAAEEVGHYISKQHDFSRGFQEFLLNAFVGVCK